MIYHKITVSKIEVGIRLILLKSKIRFTKHFHRLMGMLLIRTISQGLVSYQENTQIRFESIGGIQTHQVYGTSWVPFYLLYREYIKIFH